MAFNAFSSHSKKAYEYLRTGDVRRGWQHLMRAYRLHPGLFAGRHAEGSVSGNHQGSALGMPKECGNFSAAFCLKRLDQAVQQRPKTAEIFAWRGLIRRYALDYAGAVRDLETARALGLDNSMILTWLGEARLQTGDADGMADMENALQMSCHAWNFAWCGRAKLSFGRDREGLFYISRAIRIEPGEGWWYAWRAEAKRLLGLPDLLPDFNRALRLARRERRPWIYTWRGQAHLKQGRLRAAIKDLSAALRSMPGYTLARYARAQAFRGLGRLKNWLDDFEYAASKDFKYIDRQFSTSKEDARALLADLQKIIRRHPRFAAGWRWMGIFSGLLGEYAEADKNLSLSLKLQPKDPATHAWRAYFLYQLQKIQGAETCIARCLALQPDNAMALQMLAKIKVQKGFLDKALSCLNKAIKSEKRSVLLFADRGRLKMMLGLWREAVLDLKTALHMHPAYVSAYADLALASRKAGLIEESRQAEKKAKELDPASFERQKQLWNKYFR